MGYNTVCTVEKPLRLWNELIMVGIPVCVIYSRNDFTRDEHM